MKKCALLSCTQVNLNEYTDDEALKGPLKEIGVDADYASWDDPSVDWSQYDMALIRTTWDYTQKLPEFLAFLDKITKMGVDLYNNYEVIKWNTHKKYLFDLEDKGVRIVPTLREHNSLSVNDLLSKWNCEKVVIKPMVGLLAEGLHVLKAGDKFPEGYYENPNEYLVQPFLESITKKGEVSIFYFGGEFSHAVNKLPKQGDFRSQEQFGSSVVAFTPSDETLAMCKKTIEAVGHEVLYARVDMIQNEKGEYCLGELEMVEPCLFLEYDVNSPQNYANGLKRILDNK